MTIIETSDNRLFMVLPSGGTEAAFNAVAVRRVGGEYVTMAKARPMLVRRSGCRVVAGG